MPLENFGSILNFAEELESCNKAFFLAATKNPACTQHKELFEQLAADGEKLIKTVQRIRRENVTEMILEPVRDFVRAPFRVECGNAGTMSAPEALESARRLEEMVERYYAEAAAKIKALPEVSRELKTICKKHTAHLQRFAAL